MVTNKSLNLYFLKFPDTFYSKEVFIVEGKFVCADDNCFLRNMKYWELIVEALSALGSGVLKVMWLPVEIMGVKLNYK